MDRSNNFLRNENIMGIFQTSEELKNQIGSDITMIKDSTFKIERKDHDKISQMHKLSMNYFKEAMQFPIEMKDIRKKINELRAMSYNICLDNQYRNFSYIEMIHFIKEYKIEPLLNDIINLNTLNDILVVEIDNLFDLFYTIKENDIIKMNWEVILFYLYRLYEIKNSLIFLDYEIIKEINDNYDINFEEIKQNIDNIIENYQTMGSLMIEPLLKANEFYRIEK